MRVISILIASIKEKCGDDFLISVRFGNKNLDELCNEGKYLEEMGADILDISTGCWDYGDPPLQFMYDSKIYAASLVKQHVHIPVICVGKISTPQQATKILENHYSDFVGIGRGHLCDPLWTQKVRNNSEPITCYYCPQCAYYYNHKSCPALRNLYKK